MLVTPLLFALTLASTAAPAGDRIAAAHQRARALEASGDYPAAAKALLTVAPLVDQDYSAQLRLGWLCFKAADYDAAQRYYMRARELSGGALEARLGLAWTALRRGDLDDAEALFLGILRESPGYGNAADGLEVIRATRPATMVEPGAYGAVLTYVDHPSYDVGATGLVSLRMNLAGWLIDVDYRYASVGAVGGTTTAPGPGFAQGTVTAPVSVVQHEAYAGLGYAGEELGIQLHGGLLVTTDDLRDLRAGMFGASFRWSTYVTLQAAATHTLYEDVDVTGLMTSLGIPIGRYFSVRPGASMQIYSNRVDAAAHLDVIFGGQRCLLWIGGKLGREYRPVYLAQPTVYNLAEAIVGGANAGVEIRLARYAYVLASYELHFLRSDSLTRSTSQAFSNLNIFTVGLRLPFE